MEHETDRDRLGLLKQNLAYCERLHKNIYENPSCIGTCFFAFLHP